jgi:hypothetical protein
MKAQAIIEEERKLRCEGKRGKMQLQLKKEEEEAVE